MKSKLQYKLGLATTYRSVLSFGGGGIIGREGGKLLTSIGLLSNFELSEVPSKKCQFISQLNLSMGVSRRTLISQFGNIAPGALTVPVTGGRAAFF